MTIVSIRARLPDAGSINDDIIKSPEYAANSMTTYDTLGPLNTSHGPLDRAMARYAVHVPGSFWSPNKSQTLQAATWLTLLLAFLRVFSISTKT